uniref:Uncharacterized protein n=1 Tax=Anguilla anguilla TaxID=7936 RepID=A0A0E9RAZ2_ANGAN
MSMQRGVPLSFVTADKRGAAKLEKHRFSASGSIWRPARRWSVVLKRQATLRPGGFSLESEGRDEI